MAEDSATTQTPRALETAAAAPRRRLGPGFWLPVAWLAFVAAAAISADWLPLPDHEHMDFDNQGAAPGATGKVPMVDAGGGEVDTPWTYHLGADTMGRDITTRLIHGARVSLTIGLGAPIIGLLLGGSLGVMAGYYRGRLETAVVGVMDTILAFPALVLLLAIVFYVGGSLGNLTLTLGFLTIPAFARVARANTLTFAKREFVLAARAMGERDGAIIVREILPNVMLPLLVYALLVVAILIVVEGALAFLGLSVPNTPSWGGMIAEGKEVLDEAPHVSFIPAFVMFLTVLSFNLIGDTLRGLADPRESRL